jgi:L-glutamine-phosphate cytidylyltransferase
VRAIVIGAGRGSRLGSETAQIPKTMVRVMGRPMLDWILDALAAAGFPRSEVVFVAGYAEEVIRANYPELTIVRNADWANNNILESLLMAREYMADGFVSTYSDIVYEPDIAARLRHNPANFVLGCDVNWRRRYVGRTQHPETDAEKLRFEGARVVELSRKIPSEQATGEFIGVMKLEPGAAKTFLQAADTARERFANGVFREGRSLQRAYLIDLLAHLLEDDVEMAHEDTRGGYMEIDTNQDLSMAEAWWQSRSSLDT